MKIRPYTICLITFFCMTVPNFAQSVQRSRNEGTLAIPTSNVPGNGNINAGMIMNGAVNSLGVKSESKFSVSLGIADILEFSAKAGLVNFSRLGTTHARLQITLPDNDKLRFFGAALAGDMYLSTTADTLSNSGSVGRPEYNSFLIPLFIADLDWISLYNKFPLKTYFFVNMADSPDLLFLYNQIGIRLGLEWKMRAHSYFVDISGGFYKERPRGSFSGDETYSQKFGYIEPGIRYRLFNRYSILGGFKFLVFRDVKQKRGDNQFFLDPPFIKISAGIEIPVYYKETNTEAVRTLIFMKYEKIQKKDLISRNIEQGKALGFDSESDVSEIKTELDLPDAGQEKEMLRRREEIQTKMEKIELLLEEE